MINEMILNHEIVSYLAPLPVVYVLFSFFVLGEYEPILTAMLIKQAYQYHKLCKRFAYF